METITIYFREERNGWFFWLTAMELRKIKSLFKDAFPIASIFINHDTKAEFEQIRGRIEPHILPALLGLESAQLSQVQVVCKNTKTQQEYNFQTVNG